MKARYWKIGIIIFMGWPLSIGHGANPPPKRSQEPKRPLPYREEQGYVQNKTASIRLAGNQNVTVQTLPLKNHFFQTRRTGMPIESHLLEETMSPSVLETIGDWIKMVPSGIPEAGSLWFLWLGESLGPDRLCSSAGQCV